MYLFSIKQILNWFIALMDKTVIMILSDHLTNTIIFGITSLTILNPKISLSNTWIRISHETLGQSFSLLERERESFSDACSGALPNTWYGTSLGRVQDFTVGALCASTVNAGQSDVLFITLAYNLYGGPRYSAQWRPTDDASYDLKKSDAAGCY